MNPQTEADPNSGSRSPAAGGVIVALVIIAVGVILFLDRNGIVDGHVALSYWPLALLAAGIYLLAAPRSPRLTGAVLTVLGAALSLKPLGLLNVGIRELWPVALILVGVFMLWGSMTRRERIGSASFGMPCSSANIESSDLNERAVFGGGERSVSTQDFRGGRLDAFFGGWEIDLSQCAIQRDQAVIEVQCVFGGVELRVPDTWDVKLRASMILGGISDKTRHPRPEELATAKRLIITGSVIFGGVEIKN
jgi:predicted membrane protein